ncbi:MAG: M28 family peptidase [Bacteroidetes bacterium]|nr:MAG: M28 family peptidase [Bacteroidota bacterium]
MKRILSLMFLGVMALMLKAQEPDPSVRYAAGITAADLKAHEQFLADDLLEGRETGERGMQLAGLYIRSHFMRVGLKPGVPETQSYFQPFYLNTVDIGGSKLTLGKKTYDYGSGFVCVGGTPPPTQTGIPQFVGYGLSEAGYNNLEGLKLEGNMAMMLAGYPEQRDLSLREQFADWSARFRALQELGAATVLLVLPDTTYSLLSRFIPRRFTEVGEALSDNQSLMVMVKESAADLYLSAAKTTVAKLRAELVKSPVPPVLNLKKAPLTYVSQAERSSKPGGNVLGYLEGTDKKDELIIITAHYDHIGITNGQINNGADDDGSGTSTVLELAEAFAQAARDGYQPRRSILFMTVSGEEKGLLGSEYYTDNPIYPLANTVVDLNIDMTGRIDARYESSKDSANYVYVIGADKLSSELHTLSEKTNKTYSGLVMDYTYNDEKDPNRFYYRSDHYNFAKNNIPVIFYFTGVHVDYHKPTDDYWKLNYEKMAKIGRLVFHTAWELANQENRIVVDKKPE